MPYSRKKLSLEEFKIAFKTLKSNKANGSDDINSNVIKTSYDELLIPLFHICKTSLLQGSFPNNMKIAKITPLYKSGDVDKLCNYHPISVLPVFSKLLERIMYNRIYSHVTTINFHMKSNLAFNKTVLLITPYSN